MRVVKTVKTVGLGVVVTFGSLFALAVADKATNQLGWDVQLVNTAAAAEAKKKEEKRRTPALSEKMFKKLGKIEELVSPTEESGLKPNYPEAFKELGEMEKDCKEKCNRYELAQIYFRYAWIYATTEDYSNSLKYYDKVVAQSPDIPLGLELQSLKYMSQLAMQLDEYKRALQYLNKWMEMSDEIPPDIYDLKARICYQMDDKKCAITNINKTVSMREAEPDGIAKEAEYNLQRALYIEKEDYKTTADIMVKLLRHYPKKTYWIQLSAIYGMLERETDQLGTLEAAYVMNGITKEQTLVNLAYLYINASVPYRAAKVLEKGMADKLVKRNSKNLELLARAWQQSKDTKKAIAAMTEAAKESDSGDLYASMIGMYLDLDDSKGAIAVGKKAIKKGKLKRGGEVHLNMGVAYADLQDYAQSIKSLKKAVEDKSTERTAKSWLTYIEREYERDKAIKASQ